jgi:hypothetical protein
MGYSFYIPHVFPERLYPLKLVDNSYTYLFSLVSQFCQNNIPVFSLTD